MRQKRGKSITFRPLPWIRERLELAQEHGYEISDVVNGVLMHHLDESLAKNLEGRIKDFEKLRAAITAHK